MPPKRSPLSNSGNKDGSPLAFRADEEFSTTLACKCGELDMSRSEFVVQGCRWLYHLTNERPDLAYVSDAKIAELAPKVCNILVLLDKI